MLHHRTPFCHRYTTSARMSCFPSPHDISPLTPPTPSPLPSEQLIEHGETTPLKGSPPAPISRKDGHGNSSPPAPSLALPSRPFPRRHSHPFDTMCQLRPSYDHSTTFDTSQIQNAFPSYGKCRIVEIEKAPRPTHKTGRPKRLWQYSNRSYLSYGTGSTGRTFRYKKASFQLRGVCHCQGSPPQHGPNSVPPKTPLAPTHPTLPILIRHPCPKSPRSRNPAPRHQLVAAPPQGLIDLPFGGMIYTVSIYVCLRRLV